MILSFETGITSNVPAVGPQVQGSHHGTSCVPWTFALAAGGASVARGSLRLNPQARQLPQPEALAGKERHGLREGNLLTPG